MLLSRHLNIYWSSFYGKHEKQNNINLHLYVMFLINYNLWRGKYAAQYLNIKFQRPYQEIYRELANGRNRFPPNGINFASAGSGLMLDTNREVVWATLWLYKLNNYAFIIQNQVIYTWSKFFSPSNYYRWTNLIKRNLNGQNDLCILTLFVCTHDVVNFLKIANFILYKV